MITGIVKTWDPLKKWGFIQDEEGFDYFVHINDVRPGQSLKVNDQVKFDVSEDQRGAKAVNVTKI